MAFDGIVEEHLGTKSKQDPGFDGKHTDGYIDGHGAFTAKVTVYGPRSADDIKHYTGFSTTSDKFAFGVIGDGDYEVNYINPAKIAPLASHWAVPAAGQILDYWGNPHKLDQYTDGVYWSSGIYIHRSNQSGFAGKSGSKEVSSGCL